MGLSLARAQERERERKKGIYLKLKGADSFEDIGPKLSDSSDILRITLLTISPRYIPDTIFSKPCIKILTVALLTRLMDERGRKKKTLPATEPYLVIRVWAIGI